MPLPSFTPKLVLPADFWSKVQKLDFGCWHYGPGRRISYTPISVGGIRTFAHRAVYASIHGPIDAGMQVCHRCDNPRCVRPEHLFLGTPKSNARDYRAKYGAPLGHGSIAPTTAAARALERELYG